MNDSAGHRLCTTAGQLEPDDFNLRGREDHDDAQEIPVCRDESPDEPVGVCRRGTRLEAHGLEGSGGGCAPSCSGAGSVCTGGSTCCSGVCDVEEILIFGVGFCL